MISKKQLFRYVLIDVISTVIILVLYLTFFAIFTSTVDSIHLPDSVLELSEEEINNMAGSLQSYYFGLIGLLFIFNILIIAVYIATRAWIWGSMHGKVKIKDILKPVPKGVLWFILGALPIVGILFTLNPGIQTPALITYLVLFMYLTTVVFLNFSKTKKLELIASCKLALRPKLALTYGVILAVLFVLYQLLKRTESLLIWAGVGIILFVAVSASRFILEHIQKRG